ncbi:hypothetical protein A3X26_20655 [Salmonella enterica subsp. enterica serovar Typhimurium]|uniref:Uncharacterized protein n=15 Tax=Enterobacteriaceae TaxID=543 RepID=A0ABY7L5R1_CITFR|nr:MULTISPECIES: hypothetical protein [Enterobacteriaceae]EAT9610969.1 hypothetical protein [Salmonella enterica]EBI0098903.1 hypothetical protein [Salmonella enterica subsp. enterica serovar Johannesburg]EBM1758802.1 hypothetical protein [Salmonella enterica subsp. enterica serovar Montevideo]EBO2953324.1 hypothetical protein [Salmonella enterica subsp. enterica serovar Senftenberg]ECB6490688.1 hypothetical protein [Salmonella enterica subsp. enterica serovar Typhimurium]ECD2877789.1 hypothe
MMKGKNIVARVVREATYKWETRHKLTPEQCSEINQLMRRLSEHLACPVCKAMSLKQLRHAEYILKCGTCGEEFLINKRKESAHAS